MNSAFIEKLLFALLPLLIGATGYLIQALGDLQHDVTVLKSKISVVVTEDNKQAPNSYGELAREKLRHDLMAAIQEDRMRLALLEAKKGRP